MAASCLESESLLYGVIEISDSQYALILCPIQHATLLGNCTNTSYGLPDLQMTDFFLLYCCKYWPIQGVLSKLATDKDRSDRLFLHTKSSFVYFGRSLA